MKQPDWMASELAGVDFGDRRLNGRLIQTAMVLAAKPSASIAEACPSKAIAKGAYRMLSNSKVYEDEILKSHTVESLQRAKSCDEVYAIQDTTSLNLGRRDVKDGFGVIADNGNMATSGVFLHSTLLVSKAGRPLGLLDQFCYSRPPKPKTTRRKQRSLSRQKTARQKESRRWINALEQTASCQSLKKKVITLADRECDIYEFVATANQLSSKFIIRCCRNRQTSEGKRLFDLLKKSKVLGNHTVTIEQQSYRVNVKCITTELLPPKDRSKKTRLKALAYDPERVYVIEAKEDSSRKDRLHWILITNVPTTTLKEAISRIDVYTKRWSIEQFHRILKSGCGIEKTRLESIEAVRTMIVIKSLIAVRLFQLTMSWREDPEQACTRELTNEQWRVLHVRIFPGKALPSSPPTLKQVILWLAQLGGYKRNPEKEPPGMTMIWRGWQEFEACLSMWASFRAHEALKPDICG